MFVKVRSTAAAVLVAVSCFSLPARAADVVVLCSTGLQSALMAITPEYEKVSGDRLVVTYQSSAPLKTAIEAGARFDVAILTPGMIADLVKSGKVADGSARTLARANIGLGVRSGTARLDISTAEAFKATLLAVPSVASSAAGQSRVGLLAALDALGIAGAVNAKTRIVTAGSTGEAVLRGEAEMAVQLIPELMAVPGIDVVGPFPAALQSPVVLTGAVGAAGSGQAGAQALLAYLASPDRAALYRAKGLEPG